MKFCKLVCGQNDMSGEEAHLSGDLSVFEQHLSGHLSAHLSGESQSSVRFDVRSEESQVAENQQVNSDEPKVLSPVLPLLTLSNPLEPVNATPGNPSPQRGLSDGSERKKAEREHVTSQAGDLASKKSLFQLCVPRQSLDVFGNIVLHYADDGHESLEGIERAAVGWCGEHGLSLPDDPGSVVRRILRRADGRG
jgi:hypothetical protein